MKFGYARVSTTDQNLGMQVDALEAVNCEEIITEKVSSRTVERLAWEVLLGKLRKDDEIVVYRLDRIARSTSELLKIVEHLAKLEVGLTSIQEPWVNTTSAAGKMIITVMAGVAEFERDLIQQRAKDGRQAAVKRGVVFGRRSKLSQQQIGLIRSARSNGSSVTELAEAFQVSRDTIYRTLKLAQITD